MSAQAINKGSLPNHYFFSVDGKSKDFVAYNVDAHPLTDEDIVDADLVPLKYLVETDEIKRLKSEAWSCGCIWFFVLQNEGIYFMNVNDEHCWLCKKLSHKFIQMYLDAPETKSQKRKN